MVKILGAFQGVPGVPGDLRGVSGSFQKPSGGGGGIRMRFHGTSRRLHGRLKGSQGVTKVLQRVSGSFRRV